MLGLNNVWQCYMRVCRPCVRRCDAANKWLNKLQFPELLAEAAACESKTVTKISRINVENVRKCTNNQWNKYSRDQHKNIWQQITNYYSFACVQLQLKATFIMPGLNHSIAVFAVFWHSFSMQIIQDLVMNLLT